jgi:signal peptidase II
MIILNQFGINSMGKKNLQIIIYFLISLIAVSFDRLLKLLAVNGFFHPPIRLISDIFNLNFTANENISFSLPLRGTGVTFLISAIVIALLYALIYYIRTKEQDKAALLLVVFFGAMSNLVDRFKYGFVIDYLDLKYFTVFNLADAMIVIGVFCLAWIMMEKPAK